MAPVNTLIDAFVSKLNRRVEAHFLRTERPVRPLPDLRDSIPWGSIFTQTLHRSLLKRLPARAFVVSASRDSDDRPRFAEQIGVGGTHATLWDRAKRSGAAQRRCRVLWCAADFLAQSLR
jgi:hypothetical protein